MSTTHIEEPIVSLSSMLTCGGCDEITSLESDHTCEVCGRMLCGSCGKRCRDHRRRKHIAPHQGQCKALDGRVLNIGGRAKRHKGCE